MSSLQFPKTNFLDAYAKQKVARKDTIANYKLIHDGMDHCRLTKCKRKKKLDRNKYQKTQHQ
jgi:hypothetical protein